MLHLVFDVICSHQLISTRTVNYTQVYLLLFHMQLTFFPAFCRICSARLQTFCSLAAEGARFHILRDQHEFPDECRSSQ